MTATGLPSSHRAGALRTTTIAAELRCARRALLPHVQRLIGPHERPPWVLETASARR